MVAVGNTKVSVILHNEEIVNGELGEFYDKIKVDGHVWTINTVERGGALHLHFDKSKAELVEIRIEGETIINTKNVDFSKVNISGLG